MIEIKKLTKSYGAKKVIQNLSFDVNGGEIFAFIGHNGAGKTTTLKCIVGIHDFEAGDIKINGISIKKDPIQAKLQMAYVPDNPDLYENMTALKFINFICDMYRVPAAHRKDNIQRFAKIFSIANKLNEPISSFSHGMKQKVALIAAFAHDPEVLIMDEPFVGLDPKAVFEMKEILHKMARDGKTILFSTHVLDVAEKLCDRVAIIKQGQIIKVGSMKEVKGDKSLEKVFLDLEGDK